ncbi:MAG: hypothetical protein U0414_42875 [Polyangiaceae bacterium]
MGRYRVHCYWGMRQEDRGAAARRLHELITRLRGVSPVLGDWSFQDTSLEPVSVDDLESCERALAEGEVVFTVRKASHTAFDQ